ncbi:helix-turn-helix domain-containing protein [Janthinobacterium sp. RB2R34]|uniref:helix-turn-helix domain-containing protein n=1 Tax=Janthinobacterium sp. RB2R34 TaxID=3424193 RepID=UPI003F20BD04
MSLFTAEIVFKNFRQLPSAERAKFFALLAEPSIYAENFSHEEVFGHLAQDEFTSREAAEYLGVSMSTFRRYVSDGKIKASSEMGRNQLFATKELKAFKRSRREATEGAASIA